MEIERLIECLKNELAAVAMCSQAVNRRCAAQDDEAGARPLGEMLMDHQEAAARLSAFIEANGAQSSPQAGIRRSSSAPVEGPARVLGDKACFTALKAGEEGVLKTYDGLLRDPDTRAEVRNLITPLIRRQRKHIAQLDLLIKTIE